MRVLLVIALLSAPLLATVVDARERWWTVEAIVFERTSDGGLGSELWSTRIDEPRSDLALTPGGGIGLLAAGSTHASSIEAVPAAELAYGGVASRLTRSGRYRALLHRGWRQPALSATEALPVRLAGGDGNSVRGTVRLYASQHLHIETHLLYDRAGAGSFELRENRRVRAGELHYLDHPLFGLLLRVLPYEPPGGEYLPAAGTGDAPQGDASPPGQPPATPVRPGGG